MPAAPHPASPASPSAWRDNKRWWWLLSASFPGLVWTHLLRYQETGQVLWLWLMSAVMYGLLPLLDWWLGEDLNNPPEAAVAALEQQRWYRLVLVAFVPLPCTLR
eukprot:Opistho-1_new@44615